jgi:hypothetical protein
MFSETMRFRSGVVVTATHPKAGPLYWYFSDESSVNGPDFYGITDRIDSALLLDEGWRQGYLHRRHGNHVSMVLTMLDEEPRCLRVAGKDIGSDSEFREWMRSAEWVDKKGPTRFEQLHDHGYCHEWEVCDLPLPIVASVRPRSRSFELAMTARLNWMEMRYLNLLCYFNDAEDAQQRAITAVLDLAGEEAWYGFKYRESTPLMFVDIPELAQAYRETFSYWISWMEQEQAERVTAIMNRQPGD